MKRKNMAGFTLVELMVVVTIIALLATFGYPAYIDQVRKSRRADAKTSLQALRVNQAKWRANHATYAASAASVSATGTTASNDEHYTLRIWAPSATAFRATAVPKVGSDQAKDKCGTLVIDQDGPTDVGATVNSTTNTQWKKDCWL